MAKSEHLDILNQGVDVWNQWRRENKHIRPDLTDANLRGRQLSEADFHGAFLDRADFAEAILVRTYFRAASLQGASFCSATLAENVFDDTDLEDTDFSRALIGWEMFGRVDLSKVKGLETIVHGGPSTIGIEAIRRSGGNIPGEFLRGCGVPDNFIEYMGSLVGKAWEYYSCFISYSSKDQDFAERLHADLQAKGVRCWFAAEDMKIGDRIRRSIDEAIRIHDKLLIILSEHSIDSDWVETEVETALEKETQKKSTALFPVRLDDTVMKTSQPWAGKIRRGAPHRRLPPVERPRQLPNRIRSPHARPESGMRGKPWPIQNTSTSSSKA